MPYIIARFDSRGHPMGNSSQFRNGFYEKNGTARTVPPKDGEWSRPTAEDIGSCETRSVEQEGADEQQPLAQQVDALGHPVHGGLSKVPAGQVSHHQNQHEGEDEQGNGASVHLPGDVHQAGGHAQISQHHAHDEDHGEGMNDPALAVHKGQHAHPQQNKAQGLAGEEGPVEQLHGGGADGVLQLPDRLEEAGCKHRGRAQREQQPRAQIQLVLQVLVQDHPGCAKEQYRHKVHQRHRCRHISILLAFRSITGA